MSCELSPTPAGQPAQVLCDLQFTKTPPGRIHPPAVFCSRGSMHLQCIPCWMETFLIFPDLIPLLLILQSPQCPVPCSPLFCPGFRVGGWACAASPPTTRSFSGGGAGLVVVVMSYSSFQKAGFLSSRSPQSWKGDRLMNTQLHFNLQSDRKQLSNSGHTDVHSLPGTASGAEPAGLGCWVSESRMCPVCASVCAVACALEKNKKLSNDIAFPAVGARIWGKDPGSGSIPNEYPGPQLQAPAWLLLCVSFATPNRPVCHKTSASIHS